MYVYACMCQGRNTPGRGAPGKRDHKLNKENTNTEQREMERANNKRKRTVCGLDPPPPPQPSPRLSLIFPSVVPSNNRRRLSFCVREHSCGQSPALLDPIRCAAIHRNGSGTSVSRYPQPTDLIWMPAGSLRQRSVHQVQPAGVVFRASDVPKAFRIKRAEPGAPAKGGGRPGWVPGRFFGPDQG